MNRTETLRKSTDGYTLLEVLVALIIIGISITAVTGTLSTSTGLAARADHTIESIRILNNIMNNTPLMKTITASSRYEKAVDDETGWICRAETVPLVVTSSDLDWEKAANNTSSEKGSSAGTKSKKNSSRKRSGENIEIPGMVDVTLCLRQSSQLISKEYCISTWVKM